MVVKIASEPWEFQEIFKLNYDTFVEEIPQHQANEEGKLQDKFHPENVYIVAVEGRHLVGMLSVKDKRPFSLDHKLDDVDSYLPDYQKICEIRLLSVKRTHRGSIVFNRLMLAMKEYCYDQGFDIAIISGTVLQEKLYTKIGFIPFGPKVGTLKALYQPMYLTRHQLEASLEKLKVSINSQI